MWWSNNETTTIIQCKITDDKNDIQKFNKRQQKIEIENERWHKNNNNTLAEKKLYEEEKKKKKKKEVFLHWTTLQHSIEYNEKEFLLSQKKNNETKLMMILIQSDEIRQCSKIIAKLTHS